MYETGDNVDTVLVGGEIVVRNGRCTQVNDDDVLAEAEELALADRKANEPYLNRARAERAVLQSLITKALQKEIPLERFIRLK